MATQFLSVVSDFGMSEEVKKIRFGSYWQESADGDEKNPISWLVLAEEEGKALIISEKALDCQPYNTANTSVTWETCSLRKWLNTTFLNNAFTSEEQAKIISSTVSADENPDYYTNSGNATTDKVFLLSITEAKKYFASDEARKCIPTEYTEIKEVYTNKDYTKNGQPTCCWWLRSPGSIQNFAAFVNNDGWVYSSGYIVYYDLSGVRPALWISLEYEEVGNPKTEVMIDLKPKDDEESCYRFLWDYAKENGIQEEKALKAECAFGGAYEYRDYNFIYREILPCLPNGNIVGLAEYCNLGCDLNTARIAFTAAVACGNNDVTKKVWKEWWMSNTSEVQNSEEFFKYTPNENAMSHSAVWDLFGGPQKALMWCIRMRPESVQYLKKEIREFFPGQELATFKKWFEEFFPELSLKYFNDWLSN